MNVPATSPLEFVNDVHSSLNRTSVRLLRPERLEELGEIVGAAARAGSPIAICGGRHSMGGQQFASERTLIDMRGLKSLRDFDSQRGVVRVEGGIQWPELIRGIHELQSVEGRGRQLQWGIAQKQTGADELTLGGALSSNIHGRGLLMAPIVGDVESFTLVGPTGESHLCSRTENRELFSLAIGGYGLFGVIAEVVLRLVPRRTLRRHVRVVDIDEAIPAAAQCIEDGFVYGDFQFDIDPNSPGFLTRGVFSGYSPVEGDPVPPASQKVLSHDEWIHLLTLAHIDKSQAFTLYAQHYLATDGQLYYSDALQLSEYRDNYHGEVDRRVGAKHRGSEIITELYVPPDRLVDFLRAAASLLVEHQVPVIYGTIRLIQPDHETVLAWASQRYACIIFNLHVDHVEPSLAKAAAAFRELIDLATKLGGSYYLTYHRFAAPDQFQRAYPRAGEFFAAKRRLDPREIFQSDWYRHYAPHFADSNS